MILLQCDIVVTCLWQGVVNVVGGAVISLCPIVVGIVVDFVGAGPRF